MIDFALPFHSYSKINYHILGSKFQFKMENKSEMLVEKEAKEFITFYRNSRIIQIFKLVFDQPETGKELKSMILNFWDKFDNYILQEEEYSEFDVMCMYILDYVHKINGPSQSAVSRSLYCYLKLINLDTEDQNAVINCPDNRFVKNLREFTSLNSAEGEDLLIDALIKSFFDGNFGLSLFLLKFGLVEFPSVVNEKSKKIVGKLVERFNDSILHIFVNEQADTRSYIQLDELLDLMTHSDISFRRCVMIFFAVFVISEYRLHEQLEIVPSFHYLKQIMQHIFTIKLVCLYTIFEATTEAKIAYKDIEAFVVKFLNPLLNADFGKSLIQFSRKTLCKTFDPLDPRSLKDLARCAVRANLQKSMTVPEQVNRLDIPVALKGFLLFDYEEIFSMLKGSRHHSSYLQEEIQLALLERMLPLD